MLTTIFIILGALLIGLLTTIFIMWLGEKLTWAFDMSDTPFSMALTMLLSFTAITLMIFWWPRGQVEELIEPQEYDYIIDLNEDHIRIDTDDGRLIYIHPDSLQHFIETDNL